MEERRPKIRRFLCLAAVALALPGMLILWGLSAFRQEDVPVETTQPFPLVEIAEAQTVPTEPLPTEEDWRLLLVNPWNEIPEDFEAPELTYLMNEQAVDKRCYPDLQELMDACRAEGLSPLICSSFRTWETQEALYENKVVRVMAEGFSREDALTEAASVVAVPGTSEHQLGLAVDIVDEDVRTLTTEQENTDVQRWLMAHSWEYGFILRYPRDKTGITGIIYEPWHYRYVGREAAREIYEQDLTLEEYVGNTSQAVG